MSTEDVYDPKAIEIAVWVLQKIANQDYAFEPNGMNMGKGWELIVWQHEYEFESEYDVGNILHQARLGLVPKQPSEAAILARAFEGVARSRDISGELAGAALREIAHDLPRMVQRMESLSTSFSDELVPDEVQVYLKEAPKCFIFGRFIACLIVCRSAIEFTLRARLRGTAGTLDTLIYKELKKFPALKSALEDARKVQRAANKAVHDAVPTVEVCKEMFDKTRGVLREFYATQDPLGPLGAGLGAD